MKIDRIGNQVIIAETPGVVWLLGLLFAVIGAALVYGSLGGYSNFSEMPYYVMFLHLFGGLAAMGAGYWVVYISPITTVTIDRDSQTITHQVRRISRSFKRQYGFSEIREFQLIEVPDSDSSSGFVWYLGMALMKGEVVRISSLASSVENIKRDLVFQANEFMQKQMPTYETHIALNSETHSE